MLGDKIKKLREEDGLSQEELARKIKVHKNSIYNWENNNSIPAYEKLKEIADYFTVSIDYLLEEENENNDDKEKLTKALKEYGLDKENLTKALDIIEILKKDTR